LNRQSDPQATHVAMFAAAYDEVDKQ